MQAISQAVPPSQNPYEKAITDGWIHAGNYYQQLVSTGSYTAQPVNITATPMNTTAIQNLIGSSNANPIISQITNLTTGSNNYPAYVVANVPALSPAAAASGSIQAISLNTSSSGNVLTDQILGIFTGGSFWSNLATQLGSQNTTGCLSDSTNPNSQLGDPITCMANYGAMLANIAEITFWTALVIVIGIWVVASVMQCMLPFGPTLDKILAIVLPIASIILMLIWTAGISLALYVPLIPLLVFTFSALAWVILVIEAMLGAPLIALTLIIPSEDEIGKAGHGIIILLGLILRPALMILGFIFAQKLLMVAISMLNFGFSGALQMSVAGNGAVGPFGFVAILMMYSGIAVALVHECFSLIYVLPDKVLRWMGAGGESTEAGQHAKEMEGAHDKGAAVGKGAMKGALDKGSEALKKD
jgi:conjugal transfer/type IV secretion protein DotA/TraY